MKIDDYRVKPAKKVSLGDWDPDDKSASSGTKKEDKQRLEQLAQRIDELQDLLYAEGRHRLLIVLQGMDTAGKDGTIRHVFSEVDPLGVRVANFKAPTDEERARDFLWRIHQRVPGSGEIVIFNRSHYEDVLIVRVRQWITLDECERRYRQINEFEKMLADTGTTILKFYLHISKDEQRQRLQERVDRPDKRWKFNKGDLAERKLWDDYMKAYQDALGATSNKWAPWYVVPANSKVNRNLLISSVVLETLEGLDMKYPQPQESLDGLKVE